MSVHGFCHQCRADVPADPRYKRPCCEACGHPLIPPTWGRRTQQWVDGGWTPDLPRPDGYVWKDPALTEAEKTAKKAAATKKPTISASLDKKLRPPKPRASRAQAPEYYTIRCEHCRTTVTTRNDPAISHRRWCSEACRQRAARPSVEVAPAVCPECSTTFTPWHQGLGKPQQIYCSQRCCKRVSGRQYRVRQAAQRAMEAAS